MRSKLNTILGIETSCDETAAAILQKTGDKIEILSNVVSSSASLQQKYGGIIPEQAAREQLKVIIPVIEESLQVAGYSGQEIDAIAVTQGPGLIGSLLVGVETAKTLSLIWNKPLIPVNHLLGHFYANWITPNVSRGDSRRGAPEKDAVRPRPTSTFSGAVDWQDPEKPTPTFPCIGLLVSGGHTDLVLFKNHNDYKYLGGTRDDAAGECFDKCARLLGLPYPGGPEISKLAISGNPKSFNLPSPMLGSNDFDFSYSGLKTAVANLVNSGGAKISSGAAGRTKHQLVRSDKAEQEDIKRLPDLSHLCASIELAIIKPLVKKTLKAAKQHNVKTIILGGGVSANQKLKNSLQLSINSQQLKVKLHVPPAPLCTDNAAMIASAAFFSQKITDPLSLQAKPNLSLSIDNS